MKIKMTMVTLSTLFMLTPTAFADCVQDNYPSCDDVSIEKIRAYSNPGGAAGLQVYTSGTEASLNECGSTYLILDKNASMYDQILRILLSTQLANKVLDLRVGTGCKILYVDI